MCYSYRIFDAQHFGAHIGIHILLFNVEARLNFLCETISSDGGEGDKWISGYAMRISLGIFEYPPCLASIVNYRVEDILSGCAIVITFPFLVLLYWHAI